MLGWVVQIKAVACTYHHDPHPDTWRAKLASERTARANPIRFGYIVLSC